MKEVLCPYTANCTIWFVWIGLLIPAKAGEEKALGNPFWPGSSKKWLPTGFVPHHTSSGSAKPSSAVTMWVMGGSHQARLQDGDMGSVPPAAPGLVSPTPRQQSRPCPSCRQLTPRQSSDSSRGATAHTRLMPGITLLPFPASPWTRYLLLNLTNRRNTGLLSLETIRSSPRKPTCQRAVSAFLAVFKRSHSLHSDSPELCPVVPPLSFVFSLNKNKQGVGWGGIWWLTGGQLAKKKAFRSTPFNLQYTFYLNSALAQKASESRCESSRGTTKPQATLLLFSLQVHAVDHDKCVCLSLEKQLFFFARQVFFSLHNPNFNLTRTLSLKALGRKFWLHQLIFIAKLFQLYQLFSLHFSSNLSSCKWKMNLC